MTDLQFVVDGEDRIVQVAEEHRATMARYLGHALWVYLPGSESLLSPYFDEARETGDVVESTVFYAGGTVDVRVAPNGAFLAVQLRRRTGPERQDPCDAGSESSFDRGGASRSRARATRSTSSRVSASSSLSAASSTA